MGFIVAEEVRRAPAHLSAAVFEKYFALTGQHPRAPAFSGQHFCRQGAKMEISPFLKFLSSGAVNPPPMRPPSRLVQSLAIARQVLCRRKTRDESARLESKECRTMSVPFRQRTPGEYLNIIWKRKWLIVLPTIAIATAVTWAVMRLPNVYESSTLIVVKPSMIPEGVVPAMSEDMLTRQLNSTTQIVTSRTSLQPRRKISTLREGARARLSDGGDRRPDAQGHHRLTQHDAQRHHQWL